MTTLDPFGWFEQVVPARWLHWIIRAAALVILLSFLVMRLGQYHDYFFKPLWLAETLLFVVLAIAFIVRKDPIERSKGGQEIIIPLIGSVLPFGLLFTRPTMWLAGNDIWLTVVFVWTIIATGFTVWSMWVLRRSFSITVEARELVTAGPYRWVRHPIYLGEMLAAAAVVVWRWSLLNLLIFLSFVVIQMLRARWEEAKLLERLPAYQRFMSESWWVWQAERL